MSNAGYTAPKNGFIFYDFHGNFGAGWFRFSFNGRLIPCENDAYTTADFAGDAVVKKWYPVAKGDVIKNVFAGNSSVFTRKIWFIPARET